MGNHDTPACTESVLGGLNGFADGTDLVDLEQKSVAGLGVNSLLDELGVGDSQVITDDLGLGTRLLVVVAPCLPVLLSERVLNGNNGELGAEVVVLLSKLLVGNPLALVTVGVLEVQVVLLGICLVELAGSNIHGNLHVGVASGLDGLRDKLESLFGSLNVRSDTTLVTNVTSRLTVLLLSKALELLVDLSTLAESLGEGGSFPK